MRRLAAVGADCRVGGAVYSTPPAPAVVGTTGQDALADGSHDPGRPRSHEASAAASAISAPASPMPEPNPVPVARANDNAMSSQFPVGNRRANARSASRTSLARTTGSAAKMAAARNSPARYGQL